jgi:hypothetical protein
MGDEPDGFGLGQPCFPTRIAGYFLNGPFARRKPHLAKSSQTTLLRNDLQWIEAIVMFKEDRFAKSSPFCEQTFIIFSPGHRGQTPAMLGNLGA